MKKFLYNIVKTSSHIFYYAYFIFFTSAISLFNVLVNKFYQKIGNLDEN